MATIDEVRLSESWPLYRQTPVGIAMFDALLELLELKHLTPEQALIVATQFDATIRNVMDRITSKQYSVFSFEAELATYRLYSG